MKNSYVYFLYTIIIVSILLYSCKDKTDQNEIMFSKFPLQIQNSIDSFILSNEQKKFGVFTVFISRKKEGVVLRMNHVVKTARIENSNMGLPYSFEIRHNKLLLYYCGLELLNSKLYNENQLIKLYNEYYSKYRMSNLNGLYDIPELIIETDTKNEVNKNYSESYYLWFNDIMLMKEFVPPVIKEDN